MKSDSPLPSNGLSPSGLARSSQIPSQIRASSLGPKGPAIITPNAAGIPSSRVVLAKAAGYKGDSSQIPPLPNRSPLGPTARTSQRSKLGGSARSRLGVPARFVSKREGHTQSSRTKP